MSEPVWLVVHGGAGPAAPGRRDPAEDAAVRAALVAALATGHRSLAAGGSAVDAVVAAVRVLEDCEWLNAGRGSALDATGRVEMDAAVMDGASRRAGAVAGLRRVVNPVLAAQAVMEHCAHVLLAGSGAEDFAAERGLAARRARVLRHAAPPRAARALARACRPQRRRARRRHRRRRGARHAGPRRRRDLDGRTHRQAPGPRLG